MLPVDFRHHDDDNDDDCFANMFETCFSMFQTVLMTMMTVMTMTENMFRTPTPSVLICLKQLETCSYKTFQTNEIFAVVYQWEIDARASS